MPLIRFDMNKYEGMMIINQKKEYAVVRATELWQMTGAFSVRIQGMARQHNISLRDEFDEYDNLNTKYIVLLDEGYPIATARFYELDERSVMLGRIVVLPEYRGNGLGSLVVAEAEKWASELGYQKIEIESRLETIRFYEKQGFEQQSDEVIHGVTFDCVPMNKIIEKK